MLLEPVLTFMHAQVIHTVYPMYLNLKIAAQYVAILFLGSALDKYIRAFIYLTPSTPRVSPKLSRKLCTKY